MPEARDALDFYCRSLEQLREQLGTVLGLQTADVLIRRASCEIDVTFPAASLIRLEGSTMDLSAMRDALATSDEEQVRKTFLALHQVIALILARLVGKETASKLIPAEITDGPGAFV